MEKPYSCQYCNNRFRNKHEAERHENSLHLRKFSWSCAVISGYEAAFHPSMTSATRTFGEPTSDVCGYCGGKCSKYPRPNWYNRFRHLIDVHKFRECNPSKKFFRADHFRQHLLHSNAGRNGEWSRMLESACKQDERQDRRKLSLDSNCHLNDISSILSPARISKVESYGLLLDGEKKGPLELDEGTTWGPQQPANGGVFYAHILTKDFQIESPPKLPKSLEHNTCSNVSAQYPGSSERSLSKTKHIEHWEWLSDHEQLRRTVDAMADPEVFDNCGVFPEHLKAGGIYEQSPAIIQRTPQMVLVWLADQILRQTCVPLTMICIHPAEMWITRGARMFQKRYI